MIEPIVFQPKSSIGLPFLVFIIIIIVIGGYGIIRSMKAGGGSYYWLLAIIILVAIGIGYFVLQSRQKTEPIMIYNDRIETSSWSIHYGRIQKVREDMISSTQYSGGRPVVSTQRCLVVDTDQGAKTIAYEASFDIEKLKSALENALKDYKLE